MSEVGKSLPSSTPCCCSGVIVWFDRAPHHSKMADELDDCVWPDPSPAIDAGGSGCLVDDMSHFERARVDRIFFPRTEVDVERVLVEALRLGRQVSVRGTKHSMGGHSIARAGFLLDMQCLNAMRYDRAAQTVSCGPGCLWADLIMFLNKRCKSPRTMQSYCTFSVGGTLAVNAHGITTDFCMAESVESFRLMRILPRAARGGGGGGGDGGGPGGGGE